jgi:hypothetical protein
VAEVVLDLRRFSAPLILRYVLEESELDQQLDRVVDQIGCDVQLIERSKSTGQVVPEREVEKVVGIFGARHAHENNGGAPTASCASGGPRSSMAAPWAREWRVAR